MNKDQFGVGFPNAEPTNGGFGYRGWFPGAPYTDRGSYPFTSIGSSLFTVPATPEGITIETSGKCVAIKATNLNTHTLFITFDDTHTIRIAPDPSGSRPHSATISPIAFSRLRINAVTGGGAPASMNIIVTISENPLSVFNISP